jgi:hypothetical protein
MKTQDLGDLMREYGHHLENEMTPLDLDQVSVYQAKPKAPARSHRQMAVWAVAAVLLGTVLAVAAVYFAEPDRVADIPPPPTTVAPDVETMIDLEIIESGVAALYSGDAERAAELFELPDRPDDQIVQDAAYQAAVGGRLTLNCSELIAPGTFSCITPYHNAMTEAIGFVDLGDTTNVVVEDGEITAFAFPEHTFILVGIGNFLAMEGRFDGYEDCFYGEDLPFPETCATDQMANLDAWADWRETVEPRDMVAFALESWYGGDCVGALFIAHVDVGACAGSNPPSRTIEYESLLDAEVSLEDCEGVPPTQPERVTLSCEVHYSNVMSVAVGKPPSVSAREFSVETPDFGVGQPGGYPWYLGVYPEDSELRQSFRQFAESGDLKDDFAAGDCADARAPRCANLILDNLDDWAAWYETNG